MKEINVNLVKGVSGGIQPLNGPVFPFEGIPFNDNLRQDLEWLMMLLNQQR